MADKPGRVTGNTGVVIIGVTEEEPTAIGRPIQKITTRKRYGVGIGIGGLDKAGVIVGMAKSLQNEVLAIGGNKHLINEAGSGITLVIQGQRLVGRQRCS